MSLTKRATKSATPKTKLFTASLLLASLTACTTTGGSYPTSPKDTLTDAQLLKIAQKDNYQSESQPSRAVIGVHNGINVIEEFNCSDVCPENTLHIVYYDIDDRTQCTQAGGITKSILTPIAITVMPKEYCFPAVIADYWQSYP